MDNAHDTQWAPGIISNPGRMRGRPTIAGTRITVERVLNMIAGGYTFDDILRAYPHLTREQITAAVAYAEQLVRAQMPVSARDENPDDLGEVFGGRLSLTRMWNILLSSDYGRMASSSKR